MTTPLSVEAVIHELRVATINLSTKFEVSNSTHYEEMKHDMKCGKYVAFGVARGH